MEMSRKDMEEYDAYLTLQHRLVELLKAGDKVTARSYINAILVMWHNNKQVQCDEIPLFAWWYI